MRKSKRRTGAAGKATLAQIRRMDIQSQTEDIADQMGEGTGPQILLDDVFRTKRYAFLADSQTRTMRTLLTR